MSRIRSIRKSRYQITPEAVELFRRGVAIQAAGSRDTWEDEREYLNIQSDLADALGLKVWQDNPLDIVGEEPPPTVAAYEPWRENWYEAKALRRELERAAES